MSETYQSRLIRFHGLFEQEGWRLKSYSIAQDGVEIDPARWPAWEETVLAMLPRPACDALRPGIGFVLRHQARVGDYLVTGWWDNGNELPIRLVISDKEGGWRPAGPRESVCVWDLELVGFERDAFVATMMNGAPDPEHYLERQPDGAVD